MASAKLDSAAIKAWLQDREGWKQKSKSITKTYKFESFRNCIVFVNRVATLADEKDHHPDIDIRYDQVSITLSTHSAGGLTDKDLELAKAIDFATSAR